MTYERAGLTHWHIETDEYGNHWCGCGWTGRDYPQHLEHVRKVREMQQYNEQDVRRTRRVMEDRPWVIKIQEIGPYDEDRFEIKNLTEGELLWIHDALANKVQELTANDLIDAVHDVGSVGSTKAEDAMFLAMSIHRMARLMFFIQDLLRR